MCLKFFFYRIPQKKNIIKAKIEYLDETPPKKQKEYNNSYYSPNCTKRPLRALHKCINCECIFYSYDEINLCSKECSLSHIYRDYEFS